MSKSCIAAAIESAVCTYMVPVALALVLLLAPPLPFEGARAADDHLLLASAPKTSGPVLRFHLHTVSKTKYVYNNDGEILDHTLETFRAKNGDFQLEEVIVDDIGLISIRLSYKGKTILSKQLPRWQGLLEASYLIIDPLSNDRWTRDPIFRDINGDGAIEIILVNDSGSPHGTVDQSIYQMRRAPVSVRELCHATLQSPALIDSDHNGIYNLVIDDQTFAYWKGSAYCDYSPTTVVLSLKGSSWVANSRLMKEAPPKKSRFDKDIAELNAGLAPYDKLTKPQTRALTPPVWNAMKGYVYGGNAEYARATLDRLYPPGTSLILANNKWDDVKSQEGLTRLSREQFWKDFCDTVKKSEYAQALLAMDTHKIMQPK